MKTRKAKTQILDNASKTRRGVVIGKVAHFYSRPADPVRYRSLQLKWKAAWANHQSAVAAVAEYVTTGHIPMVADR